MSKFNKKFTGFNEWQQEMESIGGAGNIKYSISDNQKLATVKKTGVIIGYWDEKDGDGYVKESKHLSFKQFINEGDNIMSYAVDQGKRVMGSKSLQVAREYALSKNILDVFAVDTPSGKIYCPSNDLNHIGTKVPWKKLK